MQYPLGENPKKILKFLHLAESLKNELRNCCTSTNREESVAEHTWRVALFVILSSKYLDQKINIEKALKIAIVHDIVETITGDTPYFSYKFDPIKQEKIKLEEVKAINKIKKMLPAEVGLEIHELWIEFCMGESYEAKLVRAIDKMEAQIQFNETDLVHWKKDDFAYVRSGLNEYCVFDSFLTAIKNEIQKESCDKIAASNFVID